MKVLSFMLCKGQEQNLLGRICADLNEEIDSLQFRYEKSVAIKFWYCLHITYTLGNLTSLKQLAQQNNDNIVCVMFTCFYRTIACSVWEPSGYINITTVFDMKVQQTKYLKKYLKSPPIYNIDLHISHSRFFTM